MEPTKPNPPKTEKSRPNPTKPNQTHGSTQPMDNSDRNDLTSDELDSELPTACLSHVIFAFRSNWKIWTSIFHLSLKNQGLIIIMFFYYVLLRHNGSKTYSSMHTHTVIHANTSTKTQKNFKNSKNGKKEQNW